jgi:triosephosphate isomerase
MYTMRRPLVAANWKMNLTRAESVRLASEIRAGIHPEGRCEVVICPPSVYLDAVVNCTAGSFLGVGAQNVYHQDKGAYTGEISPKMLADLGVTHVILGHSERRNLLKETDHDVNLKLKAALKAGLIPIVCVGEHLEQREQGRTLLVIREQFEGSFASITSDEMDRCVIAYEPVWAIGTGKVASAEQAEQVHAELRRLLADSHGGAVAEKVRILYGGSVDAENASSLLSQANIDGALVGGASLVAERFLKIVRAASMKHPN